MTDDQDLSRQGRERAAAIEAEDEEGEELGEGQAKGKTIGKGLDGGISR